MMFGTVMMSNSNTSNNNNNHPKTNEANLLATVDSVVTTAAAAHQQQQQQQPHHLLVAANKYQQELIDNELNEKANAILKKSYKQQNNSSNPMKLNPASLQQQTRHQVYGKSVYDKVRNQNETKLEVQILPQDDWETAEGNTTAMTADFSDFGDDLVTEDGRSTSQYYCRHDEEVTRGKHSRQSSSSLRRRLKQFVSEYFGYMFTVLMLCVSFLTPILFITLPKLLSWPSSSSDPSSNTTCGIECEGLLIGIAFKLFILALGNWAIYARRPRNSLPKINELRALLLLLLLLLTFSFWLFYGVRILGQQPEQQQQHSSFDYFRILQFSSTYVDVLLFVYILSVFIVELKHLRVEYLVTVCRSPDGEQRTYSLGRMSIQRASLCILEMYYRDFAAFNPWLAQAHRKRAIQLAQLEQQQQQQALAAAANGKRSRRATANVSATSSATNIDNADTMSISTLKQQQQRKPTAPSANDRLYEEYEFERRVKKRQAKLLCVCEEAFAHVKRVQQQQPANNNDDAAAAAAHQQCPPPTLMDPYETAQALFATIARDLRRYLRASRQQAYFTRDSIVAHLAQCVSYDIAPRAFLERYTGGERLGLNERALTAAYMQATRRFSLTSTSGKLKTDQNWILICESLLYQSIENNLMVVLKQNEVTLMCTFRRMPRFSLIEDILDPKRNKFLIKLNSETTV